MDGRDDRELVERPIPGLIRKLALPATIGFFFHTMYNVVDTFYAGMISTQALAALSLSFPIFFLIIAMGSGVSTGTTALCSNALGAGKKKESQLIATQAISFSLLTGILLTIVGIAVAPFLFMILGATESYLMDALTYMNVIFLGTIFFMLAHVMNGLLSSIGNTRTFRNFLVAGFFANIILDPWLMFGGFGVPALGIAGVAWATLAIELSGVLYMGRKVIRSDLLCLDCPRVFVPRRKPFVGIAKQGFPASLNMMTVALGAFIITYFISQFGQAAVAAYGIALRIEQMILIPNIGLNIASLVLVGQNNGARKFDRVRLTIRKVHIYGFSILAIGTAALLLGAPFLMGAFSADPEVVRIGTEYLYIMAFLLYSYLILFINVSALQGLKKPMFALYIGLFRQLVIAIPVFTLFAFTFGWGLHGIWWGIFSINWLSAIVTYLYARRVFSRLGNSIKKR